MILWQTSSALSISVLYGKTWLTGKYKQWKWNRIVKLYSNAMASDSVERMKIAIATYPLFKDVYLLQGALPEKDPTQIFYFTPLGMAVKLAKNNLIDYLVHRGDIDFFKGVRE